MINILFVCTGNSCRSQMAEGWLRALAGGRFGSDSAGIAPRGQNPDAIAVMMEVGIDISGQESSVLTNAQLQWANLVVTVCGHADETCPLLPPGTQKEHWPLEDPAQAVGTRDQIMNQYRERREEIRQLVIDLIQKLVASSRSEDKS